MTLTEKRIYELLSEPMTQDSLLRLTRYSNTVLSNTLGSMVRQRIIEKTVVDNQIGYRIRIFDEPKKIEVSPPAAKPDRWKRGRKTQIDIIQAKFVRTGLAYSVNDMVEITGMNRSSVKHSLFILSQQKLISQVPGSPRDKKYKYVEAA